MLSIVVLLFIVVSLLSLFLHGLAFLIVLIAYIVNRVTSWYTKVK